MASKHALLIGVDRYGLLDDRYQLAGCVNDAKLMASVLTARYGFEPDNLIELHDQAATRQAILSAMSTLVERVEQDDIVVFHFSGHGSRRTTANPEKSGGKDSTIMPHDSGRHPEPNRDIVDDEIHAWLQELAKKTRYITLTFDCCHSGTITRDVFAGAARSVEADTRSLTDMGVDTDAVPAFSVPARTSSAGGWLGQSDAYVVLSGCRENEKSNEYSRGEGDEMVRNGALTFNLSQALTGAVAGSTYRDVFENVSQGVTTMFPNQHPQIEGQLDREVLGVTDIEPMRYVALASVADERCVLAGGAAHGLQSGSRWAIYPPGTKVPKSETQLALIDITSVGAFESTGRIVECAGELVPGARCIELSRPKSTPLSIDISALADDHAQLLTAALADSTNLECVASADDADLRAYVIRPRNSTGQSDPLPQLSEVTQPIWAVVGSDGELAMQTHPVIGHAALKGLVTDLEVVASYRNALVLNNAASELDVAFNIYQELPNGEWELANGGSARFRDGDSIAIEIVNRTAAPVWATVLQFCADKEIALLYPPNKDGERIEADTTFVFGRDKRRIRLSMPDSHEIDSGMETFKVFITTQSADYSWLCQSGAYRPEVAGKSAPRLRAAAIVGDEEDGDDWISINRSYELVR
ncbi:MAG: caspase family protein [Pseudomonadaceae bacterium]|nr:caspase family protein [Pseudomonadaceae bacterium]